MARTKEITMWLVGKTAEEAAEGIWFDEIGNAAEYARDEYEVSRADGLIWSVKAVIDFETIEPHS